MTGYPPSRVWRILYLSDINYFIVIPAKAGIQKNGKIRLFTNSSIFDVRRSIFSLFRSPEVSYRFKSSGFRGPETRGFQNNPERWTLNLVDWIRCLYWQNNVFTLLTTSRFCTKTGVSAKLGQAGTKQVSLVVHLVWIRSTRQIVSLSYHLDK